MKSGASNRSASKQFFNVNQNLNKLHLDTEQIIVFIEQ